MTTRNAGMVVDEAGGELRRLAYGIVETAHLMGVSTQTVRRLAIAGDLRSFSIGMKRMFMRSDIDRFLEGRLAANRQPQG